MQTLFVQVFGEEQVPQFKVPLHPFEIEPQFLPCAAHVVGVQVCDAEQTFAMQVCPDVQDPQDSVPEHPSETEPQFFPVGQIAAGTQTGDVQTLFVQVCPEVQANVPVCDTVAPQLLTTLFVPQNVFSAGVNVVVEGAHVQETIESAGCIVPQSHTPAE